MARRRRWCRGNLSPKRADRRPRRSRDESARPARRAAPWATRRRRSAGDMKTCATPAAAAVRRIEPTLPGSCKSSSSRQKSAMRPGAGVGVGTTASTATSAGNCENSVQAEAETASTRDAGMRASSARCATFVHCGIEDDHDFRQLRADRGRPRPDAHPRARIIPPCAGLATTRVDAPPASGADCRET